MKFIDIKTTQNVVLQYELADLRARIVAFLIDLASLILTLGILMTIASGAFRGTTLEIIWFLLLSVFMFYSLAFETLNNGQTPGKMAMRIQVIKSTTGRPGFADYAARWVFRLVDIWASLGGIASVMIASSSKSQRLGDIVANTAVVKLTSKMNLTLEDILTMHASSGYQPEYSSAKQLIENDVILIKNTLDRYRKYQNAAHAEALNMLAVRIASVLRIDPIPQDNQKFLETILRDYVVLTR